MIFSHEINFMSTRFTYEILFLSHCFFLGLCVEKRAFYRLISGLHASINVHLSARYLLQGMWHLLLFSLPLLFLDILKIFLVFTWMGKGWPDWILGSKNSLLNGSNHKGGNYRYNWTVQHTLNSLYLLLRSCSKLSISLWKYSCSLVGI